jgi:O-antigen/teichoic acid export membrane protein
VYAGKSPLIFGISAVFMFATSLAYLKPSWRHVHFKRAIPLLKLGSKFFLIQIFYIIVNQGAIMLITHHLGPAPVTEYSLALRYMSIPTMLFTMLLTPYITAFNEAYVKGDDEWIRKTMQKLRNFWWIVLLMIVLLVVVKPWFFHFWIKDEVSISFDLIILMAIQSGIVTWGIQFSLFLNGIGKVSVQVYILLLQALVFLMVTLLLFHLEMGLLSTVIALSIVTILSNVVMYIQYKRVMNKTAKGIWNR